MIKMNVFFVTLFTTISISVQLFGIYLAIFFWKNNISKLFGPLESIITILNIVVSITFCIISYYKQILSKWISQIIAGCYLAYIIPSIFSSVSFVLIIREIIKYIIDNVEDTAGYVFLFIVIAYSLASFTFSLFSEITTICYLTKNNYHQMNFAHSNLLKVPNQIQMI